MVEDENGTLNLTCIVVTQPVNHCDESTDFDLDPFFEVNSETIRRTEETYIDEPQTCEDNRGRLVTHLLCMTNCLVSTLTFTCRARDIYSHNTIQYNYSGGSYNRIAPTTIPTSKL